MRTQEGAAVSVPQMVYLGLDRADQELDRAHRAHAVTHGGRARGLGRIATLYERQARWWNVLGTWCYRTRADVHGRAALAAMLLVEQRAESYRELEAAEWRRSLAVASDSGVAA